ncbi:hypothetical protein M430DRAFT_124428 [Amorphotheca resinae ATCC 22711]|uniref:HRQ family protein 2 n=1 Tax=Amorphotheca resinae ATCC 22711 TaxID=857342 RepID=A0A2T3AVZ1_AMORE|nr:hypothetical protein M430DRAFT_124428 [Amorphotheca resinae ATCC 22711]PSS12800.1 hypothetical protein M430DRAFT_124428 [Amorphotheca resinae ATCC 22711]
MEMSCSWIVWGVAAGLILAVVHFGGVYIRGGVSERSRAVEKRTISQPAQASDEKTKDPTTEIIPLPDFDWRTTEPLKIRPFKPKYHLTMGLTNCPPSELIEIDKNYVDRLTLRKQIMQEHQSTVLQAQPIIQPAINELYTYLTSIYLPQRFPTIFQLSPGGQQLHNLATSCTLPLEPPADPIQTLALLGANLEDDFLFLLPADDGDGYVLRGFVTCFPSGFDTREKLGLKLREIHKPVPGYKEKLELSMDRFFDRLEVGRLVRRVNWSITTTPTLFTPSGTHLYTDSPLPPPLPLSPSSPSSPPIDINQTHLRCERQILHRLPQTKALVFSFKTYMYPIRQIKEEGLGEELAEAIDGLREGSVPRMYWYKRGVVWGEGVKEFLRS